MIARILLGAVVIGVGFVCVWKTEIPYSMIGPIEFAERNFSGGSRLFYKLMGIFIIFIGALILTGQENGFLDATLGKILM
jgi:hypothetical protein